jgi:hypothetical protein
METMTQKDKDLLFKDTCARLPYGVKAYVKNWSKFDRKYYEGVYTVESIHPSLNNILVYSERCSVEVIVGYDDYEIKPYLFPLSSITEEQKSYINGRWGVNEHFEFEIDPLWGEYFVDLCDAVGFINWCYENHFDINGLIPRGLAEDATDKNIY